MKYLDRLITLILVLIVFPSYIFSRLDLRYSWWLKNDIEYKDSDYVGYGTYYGIWNGGYGKKHDGTIVMLTKSLAWHRFMYIAKAPYYYFVGRRWLRFGSEGWKP